MKQCFFNILFLLMPLPLIAQDLDTDVPEGWSIYSEGTLTSTTGGGNGEVVTVSTLNDLTKYCGSNDPYIIFVEGTISGSDPISVKSNKTIIGKANSKLSGVGLSMSGVSNIIIRNMNISGSADGVAARNTHHLWVDHCELWDNGDGLLDITNQSTYCTVSWCKFYYVNQTEHRLACLIGSGGGDHPEDFGYLRVSYHHNWYGNKVDQRQPRIMYGLGHVYNGYYNCTGNTYGIGVGSYGAALIENNYFKDMKNPHYLMYNIYCWITAKGNVYDNTTGEQANGKLGVRDVVVEGSPEYTCDVKEFAEAPYLYTLDAANDVPSLVTSGAAPKSEFATIGLTPIPGQGAMAVSVDPTLSWVKGAENRDAVSYNVYLGTTTSPAKVATVTSQSYKPSTLQSGTVYYWRVDIVTSSKTIEGKLWRFQTDGTAVSNPNVAPTVNLTSPTDEQVILGDSVTISLSATAADQDGSIWKVDFYNGTELLNTATHSPYGYVWNNVPEGTYTISAIATDNEGLESEASSVTVSVVKPQSVVFESSSNDSWSNVEAWTPQREPLNVDTAIIRTGEVKIASTSDVALVKVEETGTFRITASDIVISDLVLQGGTLKSYTSNTLFTLTSDVVAEKSSTIMAGSIATSVFEMKGSLSGTGDLTKTSVGVLKLSTDGSDYSGNWSLTEGQIQVANSTALGTGNITVSSGATLDVAVSAATGNLTLENGATLLLNEDLTVGTATLDGVKLGKGTYSSSDYPDLISGTGTLTVLEETTSLSLTMSKQTLVDVYPNPTDGVTTVVISSQKKSDCKLVVLDINGIEMPISSSVSIDGATKVTLDFLGYASGIYFLKVIFEDDLMMKSIVVK